MASNKESLIVIIDVREGFNKSFKEKSIRCAADILKEKICAGRKDAITFLLVGTKRTKNLLNDRASNEYLNIVEYGESLLPNWELFRNFFKFVEEEPGTETDWLDALIVASEMHHEFEMNSKLKFAHRRVLLFHNFDDNSTSFEDFEFNVVTKSFLENGVGLIVVSDKIGYKTNTYSGEPVPVFQESKNCSQAESLENQKYALRLFTDCNAVLCNFDEALLASFKLSNSQPWCWQGQLVIGSQISIAISGMIAIKDENNIKIKKCWGEREELPAREKRFYVKGVEMDLSDDEIIKGYMLGSTAVPFDETVDDMDDEKTRYQTGLNFFGFAKKNAIPTEYYCGNSLYWIVHRKGKSASAKKLDALVQALHKKKRIMLCWKVFSAKYNTPKIVVLLPNKIQPDRPASLSMVELTYYAQHNYFDFPILKTDKIKPNQAQLQAIDQLIDSMDLMLDESHEPRQTYETELLAPTTLPHIFERNMMDVLERKVLCLLSEDDEQFRNMLTEKNFVEAYWKVPEPNEEAAKRAAAKVRELFPLEKSTRIIRKNVEVTVNTSLASSVENASETNAAADKVLSIECVGMKTPDDDFEKLIKHHVLPLKNKTNRDKQFHVYAKQMRTVIWSLIFESETLNMQNIYLAIDVYRRFCLDFNAFVDYNEWISNVKAEIQNRKNLNKFWNEVIKTRNLGLCFIGQPTLEELMKIEDFYDLSIGNTAGDAPNVSR